MKRLLKVIGDSLHHRESDASESQQTLSLVSPTGTLPPPEEWLHYRKHRGVNLGSWFVLERWITDTPFRQAQAPAASDLDIAKGTNARQILEKHWDTWITQRDWNWMASVGINSIRLPIGYYHVCGADKTILNDTDFFPYYSVYEGAWRRITEAILTASRMNMTVLIDMHAAPGKQNADPHSGTSNPANFFADPHNLRRGLYAVTSLATQLSIFCSSHSPPLTNVIGIELINEPAPPNDTVLKEWYTNAIDSVRKANQGLPIYLGECWRTDVYTEYVVEEQEKFSSSGSTPQLLVLDHHLYRCFTTSDINTSVQDHTSALLSPSGATQTTFSRVSESLGRVNGGLVVAEWSCGLNEGSLRGVKGERRAFVDAQLDVYEQYCGGWWWWTLKKEAGKDTGWSLRDAVEAGVFPAKVGLVRKRKVDSGGSGKEKERREGVLERVRKAAFDAHKLYWSRIPGTYDHDRFFTGFTDGWNDHYWFFEQLSPDAASVSEIGFKGAWAVRRGGGGKNYWEYEHGFIQGADAARKDFERVFC